MDGLRTDIRMDGRTYRQMERPSNRDVMTYLKSKFAYFFIFFTKSFKLRTSSLFLTGFLMEFLKRKVQVILFLTNSKGPKILFFRSRISLDPVMNNKEITTKLLKNHFLRSENPLEAFSLEPESTVYKFLPFKRC